MRRSSLGCGAALIVVTALAAACGDDTASADGGPGVDGGNVDGGATTTEQARREACDRLATARCARQDECLPDAFDNPGYDCLTATRTHCLRDLAPRSNIQLTDLDACTARVTTTSCAELTAQEKLCDYPPGQLTTDEPCRTDSECLSGFCRQALDCYRCWAFVDPHTQHEGEACSESVLCVGGFDCVGSVCRARTAAEGAPCGQGLPLCDPLATLHCDDATKRCVRFVPSAVNCFGPDEQPSCVRGRVCSIIKCYDKDHCAYACYGKHALGESCGTSEYCEDGLECSLGTSTCVEHGTGECTEVAPPPP